MKKKKIVYSGFLIFIILIISFFIFNISQNAEKYNEIKKNRATMSSVILKDINGQRFSTTDIPKKGFTLIIFFNPDCHYCQLEAQEINEKIDTFKNFSIYFISSSSQPEIQKFANTYELNDKENTTFLVDYTESFSQSVGVNTFPFILLYNENHELIQTYKGNVNLNLILEDAKKYRETSS